jgi:paraquat-inducible protein B
MNEPDRQAETPRRTMAATRTTRWPGWIWGIPIAAIGLVVWLLVRTLSSHGIEVTVIYTNAHGMQPGSTRVMYRGVRVGTVTSVALASDNLHVIVDLDIEKSLAGELRSGTHFFLEGAHPSLLHPSSLMTLISGPVIVMRPGGGAPTRSFKGIESNPYKMFAVSLPYRVKFDAAIGNLPVHSPVTLRGFTVGQVASVGLRIDRRTGRISTPVVLDLDPSRFHFVGRGIAAGYSRRTFNRLLGRLVRKGLRARLTRSLPLVGSRQVVLEMVAGAAPAHLETAQRYPLIPTAPGGGLAALSRTLGSLPLTQIAANVRTLTAQLSRLVSSPQLRGSIAHLDGTLAALEQTVRQAGPQVSPTLVSLRLTAKQLRAVAQQIDVTTEAARGTLGASPTAPNGNVEHTLTALAGAARAIRSLANYLDQHPGALLRGRTE